jgi:hypothetical protein
MCVLKCSLEARGGGGYTFLVTINCLFSATVASKASQMVWVGVCVWGGYSRSKGVSVATVESKASLLAQP